MDKPAIQLNVILSKIRCMMDAVDLKILTEEEAHLPELRAKAKELMAECGEI